MPRIHAEIFPKGNDLLFDGTSGEYTLYLTNLRKRRKSDFVNFEWAPRLLFEKCVTAMWILRFLLLLLRCP